MSDNILNKTKTSEIEERNKYFSSNLARVIFSILVLYVSKELNVINILMGNHLIISIIWFLLSYKFPTFQSKYPFYWLIPASLDILNCLMIIYVTGSAYSSWILSLSIISAISAMDKLKWRGLFTGITSSIGLAILLILVQLKVLPFIDIWKINYRPHSWILVIQASLLNAVVSFFLWESLHKISVININARDKAEKYNILINTFLKKIFQENIIEKIQNDKIEFSNFSPIVIIELKIKNNSESDFNLNEIYDLILPVCNQFKFNRISNENDFFAFCKLNSSEDLKTLIESINVIQKIYKEINNIIHRKNPNFEVQISSGIALEKLVSIEMEYNNSIYLLEQSPLNLARRLSLFDNKNTIFFSSNVYKYIKNTYSCNEEGKIVYNGKLESVYSIKYEE